MTPKQIIGVFRAQAFDLGEPPRWSDNALLGYLNEARYEAARRSRLIEDVTTAEICKIKLKPDKAIYDIDPRVIFVRRVKVSSQDRSLPKVDLRWLDDADPGWEVRGSGQPSAWLPWGDRQIRFVDAPDAAEDVTLTVVREPLGLLGINDGEDEDIQARYHWKLIDFMKGRAYMEQDKLEKYRPEEAASCMKLFDAEFGPPSSARDERWIHRRHGYDELEGLY